MDIAESRMFRCILCEDGRIYEHRIEHTYEGAVPDQCNCDLSSYTPVPVSGGRLFTNRPQSSPWLTDSMHKLRRLMQDTFVEFGDEKKEEQDRAWVGGLCDACLAERIVQALLPVLPLEPLVK